MLQPPHEHIFHLFDPCMKHHHRHPDEVDFSKGRYIDIASTKNKDPHTLYFGTSQTSDLLTGIFLGDIELTSKVKDVQLEQDESGAVVITVKYINDNHKLATVKTKLSTSKQIEDLIEAVEKMKDFAFAEESRIIDLEEKVKTLEDQTATLDSSINWIKDELEDGIFNYTIKKDDGDYSNGYKKTFTLFKGEDTQVNSEKIEVTDMGLRRLTYIDDDNTLVATIFPVAIKDEDVNEFDAVNRVVKFNEEVTENGITGVRTFELEKEYVQNVSINLNGYDEHINIKMNTDSSINDRLTFVEDQLTWEKLFN